MGACHNKSQSHILVKHILANKRWFTKNYKKKKRDREEYKINRNLVVKPSE